MLGALDDDGEGGRAGGRRARGFVEAENVDGLVKRICGVQSLRREVLRLPRLMVRIEFGFDEK